MTKPPETPPSSDLNGVDRDEARTIAPRKAPAADQQQRLAAVREDDVARPPADPEMVQEGNPQ